MKPGILLLGNYPPPFGGVPSHVRDVSSHLASHGWQVHVMVGKTHTFGIERPEPGVTVYRFDRPRTLRALLTLPGPRRGLRQFFPRLRPYLGQLGLCKLALSIIRTHNVKVISAYHILGAGTLGAWLSRETTIPLITTVFGEIYSRTGDHWQRFDEVKFVADHTRRWLSCSCHCARSPALLGVDWNVEPLVYGIDVRHFHPDADGGSIRTRFGWSPEDRVVGFVGRMNAEMGLDILLQAIPLILAKDPGIRFLIAGAKQHLTPSVAQVAKVFPANIGYQTNVPYAELPRFYAASSVVAAPSVNARACLGLSIAEAMATGRPVVGCRVGGTLEVMRDGETGVVVPPSDPFALGQAILDLLANPAAGRALGLGGRARAVAAFDKAVTNAKFEAILTELTGARRLRDPAQSSVGA
jgi:glycosyltransferase involved in cell wall biosynthesis